MERGTINRIQGRLLDHELAVFVEQLAIDMDFAVVPHVTDHVPMHGAVVFAARLRVALANRHVNRAADFFVEQDVARELLDAEVGADGELAQITCARVGVQLRLE